MERLRLYCLGEIRLQPSDSLNMNRYLRSPNQKVCGLVDAWQDLAIELPVVAWSTYIFGTD